MKKNIISRMKSKKAKLAAGVLAIILGMFPATAEAQTQYTRAIQWINGVAQNPFTNAADPPYPGVDRVTNPSGWYATMSNENVNYFTANGLSYVTNSIFEADGGNGFNINQNYNTESAAIPAYTMRSGYYVSDGSVTPTGTAINPYTAQIRLLNSNGGSLVLTPWAGHSGESGTTANSYRAMAHRGGASTLNFVNYNSTNKIDIEGSVMYITAGAYTLRGATTSGFYNSVLRNFNAAKDANGNWTTNGNAYGVSQSNNVASWIYFDNNYATSGGAIYNAEGSLTLERVVFGYRYDEDRTATEFDDRTLASQGNVATDRGGAIYNAKTLSLSATVFVRNRATGTRINSGGGAIYNTTDGSITGGGLTSSFAYNTATLRGGAIYNQGTITLSAQFENNESQFGGAIFNEGRINMNGSTSGAMEFISNEALTVGGVAGRGGAIYNDSLGTANFSNIRFESNTATGGYGGAIYNENLLTLTSVDLHKNTALLGGAIYNVASGSVTTVSGVTFDENEVEVNGDGGAIYNSQGTISLSNTRFTRNRASTGVGGAIYTFMGMVGFNSTELSNNQALQGGAVYNNEGTLNIAGGTFNTNIATVGNGGAIYNNGNNGTVNITGSTRMDGNTADTGVGGAIYNANLAEINLTNNNNSSFSSNRALEGGAIYNDEGGRLTLVGGNSRVTFSNNKATTGDGGAIYSSLDGTLTLDNVWFTENSANSATGGDGGAIFSDLRGNLTISGGQFSTNTATGDGGAIYNGVDGVLTVTGTVFTGNSAGGDGGAIYNDQNGVLTLNNVSFTKNTATGLGGAIYNDSAIVNVNVTTAATTHSSFGDGTAGADTIYFTGAGNEFNVNVANTTRSLLMYGAMTGDATAEIDITKDGLGIWDHQTDSTFNGPSTTFTVLDGTFRLKNGKTLNLDGGGGTTDSYLELASPTNPATARTSVTQYDGTASLILEENSLITTDILVTQAGSSIVAGLTTVTATGFTVSSPRAFTLGTAAVTANEGRISTDVFQIDGKTTIIANAFDIQTAPGGAASATGAGLHYENATFLASSQDGPFLDLRSTLPGTDVTLASDIYISRPQEFVTNGYGMLVLAEVTNNGTFNGGATPTTGSFYIFNGTTYETGVITPFTRSTAATLYEGLSLTSNADNTGSWIVYTMMNQNAKSEDLTWTGTDVDAGLWLWNELDKTNWTGAVNGIPVNQFLNGDSVTFADTAKGAVVVNKTVSLAEDITVGAMTVTGSEYKFNLNNYNITGDANASANATGIVDFGGNTVINVSAGAVLGDAGSVITAESIVLDTNSDNTPTKQYGLHFDTAAVGTGDGSKFLELELTTADIIDVASDIYVTTPNPTFNGTMILVEALGGSTLTQTGTFYVDGYVPGPFARSDTAGQTFLGIDLINGDTQIVLHLVDKSTRTTLTWAGVYPSPSGTVDSLWTPNNTVVQNWRGTISGNPVTTFLNGDSVLFADTFNGTTVTNKVVNVGSLAAPGNVTVGDMTVTGSAYRFNLTYGGITAQATTTPLAAGNIDFGTATLANGSTTVAGTVGRTVTAAGTITFAGGNDFFFNLAGAVDGNTMLDLNATGGVIVTDTDNLIGSGRIDVYNVSAGLTAGDEIILVDAGTNGVTTNTGRLYRDGQAVVFNRETTPGTLVLGLATDTNQSQLLLTMIDADTVCTNLVWSGIGATDAWDVNTTRNWAGNVGGHYVTTFLNGDTVAFGATYVDANGAMQNVVNKTVAIAAGGVTVAGMNVTDAGYTFDLSDGGITSNGGVNFASSAIATGTLGGSVIATTGTIAFDGGNAFDFDLTGATNGATILTLNAAAVTGTIGDGRIDVSNVSIAAGESITLIDDVGTNGTVVATGDLYEDGVLVEFERDADSTRVILGLTTGNLNSQLILTTIQTDTVTGLNWSGVTDTAWVHNNRSKENWSGYVGSNYVTSFLNGDTVTFADTYVDENGTIQNVARKTVDVATGGVTVGGMNVTGTGYTFNVTNGNIDSTGNISFGSSAIVANYVSDATNRTISAAGTIAFAGLNHFSFNLTGADNGDTVLTLDAAAVTGTVGNGRIDVYNVSSGFSVGDTIVLVNTGNGVVNPVGTLYNDGVEVVFSRDTDPSAAVLGITTDVTGTQLLLTMINADASSNDLKWSGVNGTAWDVNATRNWAGTVYGHFVDKFLNGDTVEFAETYVDENGDTQFVNQRTVAVATGGVTVGEMTVSGSGYTFDLTVGASPCIVGTGNIDLGDASLNIRGFTGQYGDPATTVLVSGGTLSGFDPPNYTVDGQTGNPDFITANVYRGSADRNGKDVNSIYVEAYLSWYAYNPDEAHGNFTVNDYFEITTDLHDNTDVNPATNNYGWDGTVLNKYGNGTLVLSGNSTYTGGTIINGGKVVAGNVNGVGTGEVAILGTNKFEVSAGGTFDNAIHGTNAGSEVIFGSPTNETLTVTGVDDQGRRTDYAGSTTISEGVVRLTANNATGLNQADKLVTVNADATLELAFGVTGVDPCTPNVLPADAMYNKQITGAGGVSVADGLVVLTNTANNYTGATTINGGSMIVDNYGVISGTSGVSIAAGGTFTLGFSGEFDKLISGAGKLYVNPLRNNADGNGTTTLSQNNSGFTGDTEVCTGILELTHINATGNAAVNSLVTLRSGTTLEFGGTADGEYNKTITEVAQAGANVVKSGTGSVSLMRANSYTGGTTVSGGELVARNLNAVGTGTVDLVGGTFSVLVDVGGSFTNLIDGSGEVNFGTTSGTLNLTAANFGYVGKTAITDGTVKLTNLESSTWSADSEELAVNDYATLIVASGGTLGKTLTGGENAVFEKASAGTNQNNVLILTGNNSGFDGTLRVTSGTLAAGTRDSLGSGDSMVELYNNTTLDFLAGVGTGAVLENAVNLVSGNTTINTDSGVYVTLGGVVSGNATLVKTGVGTLKLTNENNSYKALNVNVGTVVADIKSISQVDSIRNVATLELIVNEDTTLNTVIDSTGGTFIKSGGGTLDMGKNEFHSDVFVVNSGAIKVQLSLSNSYAVIAGSFSGQENSTIIGNYEGSAGLARGSDRAIRLLALRGAGANGFSNYEFTSSNARVNGTWDFDSSTNSGYFLVWLNSFVDTYGDGLSYNAEQAADAADALPDDNPLMEALTSYEDRGGNMYDAFSSLHGEVYMSSIYANADLQRNFNQLILNRRLLCEHCKEFKQFRSQDSHVIQRELWATFTGGGNFRTEFDRFSGYNIGRWGIAGGLEHSLARGFLTGVALGYDQANLDLSDLPQGDDFYAFRLAAYTNYTISDVSMTGFFGYSKNWHEVERNIAFLGEKSRAKYDDDVLTFGFDVAKTYHWNNISIIPSIGLSYVHIRTPYIAETGADLAKLNVHSDRYDSLRVPIGVRTNSTFGIQGVAFTPEFRAFYVPELANDKVRGYTSYASAPGNGFLVDTGVRGRDGFRLGIGVQAQLFDFMSIGVDYDTEIWSKYSRHDVGANVKLRW